MEIGTIGAGAFAQAFAKRALKAGHKVKLSNSRGPDRSCPGSGGKQRWRILPVGEVPDQPAAWQGGHRRNTPWGSVSGSPRERMRTSLSR